MTGTFFTERQQKVVAAALTVLSGIALAYALFYLAMLVVRFFSYFSGVFLPFAVAGILAIMVKPYYEALLRHVRSPVLAVILVFASVLVPLALLFWFFGAVIVSQLSGLMDRIPEYMDRLQIAVQQRLPAVLEFIRENDIGGRIREIFRQHTREIVSGLNTLGSGVVSVGSGFFLWIASLLGWAVLPVYFGFFLMGRPVKRSSVEGMFPFLKAETRNDVVYLGTEFVNILVAFFRGQIIVSMAQGILYAIGFMIVGLQYGVVIGLLMGLLNIVPYLGSMIGLSIALPTAFFMAGGGWLPLVAVLVVIVVVQMIEGYILTPRIMGERTGLHPMAIIFGIFFWGSALGGLMGMILGIPLTAFLVVFWRLLKTKYVKEMM